MNPRAASQIQDLQEVYSKTEFEAAVVAILAAAAKETDVKLANAAKEAEVKLAAAVKEAVEKENKKAIANYIKQEKIRKVRRISSYIILSILTNK